MPARRSIASRCGSTKSAKLRCRLQEELVPLGELPPRNFGGDQSRRPGPRRISHGHAQPPSVRFPPPTSSGSTPLKPQTYSPDAALKALQGEGFRMENGALKDKDGNEVVFSIITNAGNKARERMATMIQEDLQKIGIHVNVVTLDFPSLIERMTQTSTMKPSCWA
jgi:ABC-type transport system substrate-binding protein